MSAAKITDQDHIVVFNKHGVIIKNSEGQVRVVAGRINDLYYVGEGNKKVCAM
ncbi:hypothetical protein WN55_06722 [Dufourea novaeangliae]|uniref:Uncharacterized protein n=1 Tax=Dufourea novaeangliae TaxID=178035 RepID=A0A154PQX8_DUFNO|nr:hypothetical protein WN55_06722 [Dufourea novaeangliae]